MADSLPTRSKCSCPDENTRLGNCPVHGRLMATHKSLGLPQQTDAVGDGPMIGRSDHQDTATGVRGADAARGAYYPQHLICMACGNEIRRRWWRFGHCVFHGLVWGRKGWRS